VCGKIFWRRGQAPFAGQRPEGCFAQMVPVPLPLPENLAAHQYQKMIRRLLDLYASRFQ
jgi:hypothetical protein